MPSARPPAKKPPQQGANTDGNYFEIGSTLRNRFLILKLLGAGAFGQVFMAKDNRDNMDTAIKTEKLDVRKRCLCMEVAVMRDIGNCTHVPYIVACGRTKQCRYIVMECLGKSLQDIIRLYRGRVELPVICQIGLQSLTALKEVHECGFVHRDVKPANFAFGKHPKVIKHLFVYDFGLARIHLYEDGKARTRRARPGFRGTLRYASLASHYGDDLGRADDLIPIYYMLVEMRRKLAWSGVSEREQIKHLKEYTPMVEQCAGMPKEFARLGQALHDAHYKSQPRYDKLAGLLTSVLVKLQVDPNENIPLRGIDE